jgi:hypothetical protein
MGQLTFLDWLFAELHANLAECCFFRHKWRRIAFSSYCTKSRIIQSPQTNHSESRSHASGSCLWLWLTLGSAGMVVQPICWPKCSTYLVCSHIFCSDVTQSHLYCISWLEGSVKNYTNRCLYVIALLDSEYVRWPTAEEQQRYCLDSPHNFFDGLVGLVNGTIFPLVLAPTQHKEDYWMCKRVYALKSLIICNCHHRIIYTLHGWCSSAHDQHVFKNSKVCSVDQFIASS